MASVLVVDDGELQDVRALLQEFGTEFVHLQGQDIPEEIEDPKTLLVTTARRAVCLRYRSSGVRPRPPVRIAVCTGSSKTQRSILKRAGFDYLVRRPVHPAALRLLLLRALYHGKEKRHSTRFAFGQIVNYRTTFRRRKAMLAEISAYGARLLTRNHLTPGTQVLIQLPREVAGGRSLELRCRVVRVEQGDREHAAEGDLSVGLRFDHLDDEAKGRLRKLLVELYWGPVMLPDAATAPEESPIRPGVAGPIEPGTEQRTDAPAHSAPASTDPQAREPETTSVAGDESTGIEEKEGSDGEPEHSPRRRHPRLAFDREVIAMCPEATRVLVGRDLSRGGMRVEPHPKLTIGDRVRAALYADAGDDPFVVEARVVRDDAELGLALRFDWMDADAERQLDQLLEALPSIQSLEPSDTVPVVLTELVPEPEKSDNH
jgi:hypothetical protein